MDESAYVAVARVGKPHGVRGEVTVRWHGSSPDVLKDLEAVRLGRQGLKGAGRRMAVKGWRPHKGSVLIKFAGVDDRNAAEKLRGLDILLERELLPEPDEGEVLLHDIMGFSIATADGRRLGVLDGFFETAATEVWSIRAEDGGEILFPAEPEFVAAIDMDKGLITVEPPPGLVDIYTKAGD